MVFETIWNCIENIENNVSKACILTVFEIMDSDAFMLDDL